MSGKIKLLLGQLLLVAALLLCGTSVMAMENEECQGCHADSSIVGEELTIDVDGFATTKHGEMGCTTCHEMGEEHPGGEPTGRIACADCHSETAEEYARSKHSEMATCTDCHNPHAARGVTKVSGFVMNSMCASCHDHDEMTKLHERWLPKAEIHFSKAPCISCHTGSEDVIITWYLVDQHGPAGDFQLAPLDKLRQVVGSDQIASLVDVNANGSITMPELRAFNANRLQQDLQLVGMMTPEKVTHTFSIMENRWDCTFCHVQGGERSQTSFVTFPEPGGALKRVEVEKGAVIDALYGAPDFYMIGATRSKTLDIVGLLILLGGLAMPVGHGFLRLLTRRNRHAHHGPTKPVYLHPTPVRIWHWLNAFGFIVLIVTGIQIRYPDYAYFFMNYKTAIDLHDAAGIVVAASFFIWLLYYFLTRRFMRIYVPTVDDLIHGLFRQIKFYFFTYFFGAPAPHHPSPDNKFNPLQKFAYLAIMLGLVPLVTVSGLLLLNIAPLRDMLIAYGGLRVLAGIHYLLGCCSVAFLCTHFYLTTLGHTPLAHTKAMWIGWEDEPVDEHKH